MDQSKNIKQTSYTGGDEFFKQMIDEGIADDNFIREIVNMFLSEGAESLTALKTAYRDKEIKKVKLYAHKLKSSFMMFDMTDAHELATQLETIDKENFPEMAVILKNLEEACQWHFEALKKKYL